MPPSFSARKFNFDNWLFTKISGVVDKGWFESTVASSITDQNLINHLYHYLPALGTSRCQAKLHPLFLKVVLMLLLLMSYCTGLLIKDIFWLLYCNCKCLTITKTPTWILLPASTHHVNPEGFWNLENLSWRRFYSNEVCRFETLFY